jgi:hypothetical protein
VASEWQPTNAVAAMSTATIVRPAMSILLVIGNQSPLLLRGSMTR